MSHYINRFQASTAERAIEACDRLKIDLFRQESGNVVVNFEFHGSIGEYQDADDDEGGAVAEPADLSLLAELLERFQRKGGGA